MREGEGGRGVGGNARWGEREREECMCVRETGMRGYGRGGAGTIVCVVGGAALAAHGLVEELLVAVQALGRRPAHDGGDGAPLGGHDLGKMKELLVLLRKAASERGRGGRRRGEGGERDLAGPLGLLDAGVEPLIPAGLALLRTLPRQKRGNARPLILAVLHHRRLGGVRGGDIIPRAETKGLIVEGGGGGGNGEVKRRS